MKKNTGVIFVALLVIANAGMVKANPDDITAEELENTRKLQHKIASRCQQECRLFNKKSCVASCWDRYIERQLRQVFWQSRGECTGQKSPGRVGRDIFVPEGLVSKKNEEREINSFLASSDRAGVSCVEDQLNQFICVLTKLKEERSEEASSCRAFRWKFRKKG